MFALRHLILRNRALAVWFVAAALLMKILVPAGFMPTASGNTMIVQLCSGSGPQTMVVEIPGKTSSPDKAHGAADMPCAFSGLSAPSLAGADPALLVLAILFVFAVALHAPIATLAPLPAYLRPPLRGPPANP